LESSSAEKKIVSLQLGRVLKNDFRIVKVCEWGFPQVIESSLIADGKPFPTLFWLSCPFLKEEVSRLESAGMIAGFEKRVEEDEAFAAEYLGAHSRTALLKEKLLEKSSVSDEQKRVIMERGIGGIRNPNKVKCLHLQLANFLGGVPNPVGREVWNLLKNTQCSYKRVICEELLSKHE